MATQSFDDFCVNERVEQKTNLTKLWIGNGKKSVRGEKCIRNQPLVDKDHILLPPLHIKLGLMKNFIKAMNKHDKDCI